MRVLITGAFGYLGGRLTESLALNEKYSLILGTRKAPNLTEVVGKNIVQTIWKSSADLERICENIDIIIHLAGMNAQDCSIDPVAALEVNGAYTEKLLNAAINQGIKRFIYISTAHVYSNPLSGMILEENSLSNLHPYATSHRAGEDVVRLAHKNNRIEGVVIRLSNSFGAPVNQNANCWMLLVNDICKQVVCERKIVLKSDGKQKINFITMSDACHAIEYLTSLDASKLDDGVFNVGGKLMNIMEMALLVKKRSIAIFNYQSEITHKEIKQNILIPDFEFNTDKILSSGLVLNGDYNYEVDGLLLACKSFYGTMS